VQRVCIEREGMYSPADALSSSSRDHASIADSDRAPLLASAAVRVSPAAAAASSSYYAADKGSDPGFHTSLLKEREKGIQEIQLQINEVNEIFQDLAVLVNEQVCAFDTCDPPETRVNGHTYTEGVEGGV
jgi:hypothetical protein